MSNGLGLVLLLSWCLSTSGVAQDQARRAKGLDAWEQVYSVLVYPRCINCPS
jgi:hypothetical protein